MFELDALRSKGNMVSKPVTPLGASSNDVFFSSSECGAWSVSIKSINLIACQRERWPSFETRGGLILAKVLITLSSSLVKKR